MNQPAPTDLRISISGIRGVVGRGLTPQAICRYVTAFGQFLPPGPVLVARDARPSGSMLSFLVSANLQYSGHDVIDLGLAPTPTVGFSVRKLGAVGAVNITASHNPVEWNALKFFNQQGLFLSGEEFRMLKPLFKAPEPETAWDHIGSYTANPQTLNNHLDHILPHICEPCIRKRHFRVVLDGCHSVGGPALSCLLKRLNCELIALDCQPDGLFSRGLEPLPENLGVLCQLVKDHQADLGIAVDPDSDRIAFVDETGRPIGEELSLVLAAERVFSKQPNGAKGCLVSNLSSTSLLDEVARRHGVPLYRTKIGEAHVVARMLETKALIGGEGNGGVIFPAVHPGRDALSGAALVLDLLTERRQSLSQAVAEFPALFMVKAKAPLGKSLNKSLRTTLAKALGAKKVDLLDGAKFLLDGAWVHVRVSNTEPVVRIIAEAESLDRANQLTGAASDLLS